MFLHDFQDQGLFVNVNYKMTSITLYLRQYRNYSGSDKRQDFPEMKRGKTTLAIIFHLFYNCDCK